MRRGISQFAFLLALGASVFGTPAYAAPTPILSYQARFADSFGASVADGTYAMRFKIYSVATDGTALWEESHTANVSDGVVSVRLGTSETIGLDFNSGDYYLGVTIGNDSELSPRIQLGAVPFAANTAKLDGKSVGTSANNVLGLNSSGGFSLGGTVQTSGDLDAGTSTLDKLTVSTDSAFQAGLVVANDLQAGTTTLDRLTVENGLTVEAGTVDLPTASIAAGDLNVAAINAQGKIKALTSDYIDNLNGSALTSIGAASIQNDTIDFTKLSNALTLDANTTITIGNTLQHNVIAGGEYAISIGGANAIVVDNTGIEFLDTIRSGSDMLLESDDGTTSPITLIMAATQTEKLLAIQTSGGGTVGGFGPTGALNFGDGTQQGVIVQVVAESTTVTRSYHQINALGAANLATINGGEDGDILILRPTGTSTITLKHATGNLRLAGAVDFAMDSANDMIMLFRDGSVWYSMSQSSNN